MLSIAFMSNKGSIYRLDSGLLTPESRQKVATTANGLSVKWANAGYYPDGVLGRSAVLTDGDKISKDMGYTVAQALDVPVGASLNEAELGLAPLVGVSSGAVLRGRLSELLPKDVTNVVICTTQGHVESMRDDLSKGRKLRKIEPEFGNVSVLRFDAKRWDKANGKHLSGAFALEHQAYVPSTQLTHVDEVGRLILAPAREVEYAAIAERDLLKKSGYKAPEL